MWPIRFVAGAVPGKRSAAAKEPSVEAKREDYERRLDQPFSTKWQEGREWLQYDTQAYMIFFFQA